MTIEELVGLHMNLLEWNKEEYLEFRDNSVYFQFMELVSSSTETFERLLNKMRDARAKSNTLLDEVNSKFDEETIEIRRTYSRQLRNVSTRIEELNDDFLDFVMNDKQWYSNEASKRTEPCSIYTWMKMYTDDENDYEPIPNKKLFEFYEYWYADLKKYVELIDERGYKIIEEYNKLIDLCKYILRRSKICQLKKKILKRVMREFHRRDSKTVSRRDRRRFRTPERYRH